MLLRTGSLLVKKTVWKTTLSCSIYTLVGYILDMHCDAKTEI